VYDLDSLGATGAFLYRELYLFSCPQMAYPVVRDGQIVDKDLAQVIGLNVTKAFGTIKPFYRAYDTT
jgi:hypothetical protein